METTFADLSTEILRDRVLRARKMTVAEKFFAGRELFEVGCEFSRGGIRMQHPHASEDEVELLLKKRLEIGTQLEEASRQSRTEFADELP